ncbi:MAG: proline--tRNA ligase [Candidatus Rokubacteria bacterium GWC2_70_16]|nr:MAG: proline--tRNA ligase [Candidatus Rokubacteria bacterium GWC2_70_16]OGL21235.1 MAG: proline--tRNA ligase [Candidatus Rokubacteria bacterium RIFCSPLOWO2_12_FULL_71_19]
MRWHRSLIPTLREDPAEAEAISHRLMVRAGLVRQLAAGIYVYLPAGLRVLDKVTAIIRQEMNAIGGQELTMPVLQPAEIWQQSGRWEAIGGEMFRLKDRNQRDMCLGMTHEEVVAWLAAREIRSYRDLPQVWYQIQTKERDEARPRSGVLRTREFLMKDSYTLDPDQVALDKSYNDHKGAYCRIFDRCGVRYVVVDSDPGMMGGSGSHEFMAPSAAGEDEVALCDSCGYAANVELARGVPAPAPAPAWTLREVATPEARTIAEVCALLGIEPALTIKSLVFVGAEGPVLALVRGDHALHERKLARALRGEARPAHAGEVHEQLGAPAGFVGPVKVSGVTRIVADESLRQGSYVAGANREGYHLTGVVAGRDFQCEWADLQAVLPGEACPSCGAALRVERVIEVGNIFKLGTKYSVPLGAVYLDEHGRERPIVMGSYGIGPARIAAAAVEQRHDADGIVWPWNIAPFQVHLIPVASREAVQAAAAEDIYRELVAAGFEVLLDDRDERAGVKFKDADLLGVPIRVTVGQGFVREGLVEIRERATRRERKVPRAEVLATLRTVAGEVAGG